MGIVDDDVRAVRDGADIVQIITPHVPLKRVGRQWSGLCPFHTEKTPSFFVSAEKGVYHCHGCQASGDVITFVQEIEQLDFVGAVEWLAPKAGVQLRYTEGGEGGKRKRRTELLEIVEAAVDFYHRRLLSSDDAGAARGYLRSRGYDRELVERFRLGWAPDDWDALARRLKVDDRTLDESGLGFINSRERQQDSFRARIMFPIFDANTAPVAFGGRVMPGGEGSKYINSRETSIYTKSRTLYGLNWAKKSAVTADELVVCEGYTDVIGFAVAGIDRAVATCGTALTEDHVKVMKRFVNRVVLAFDADSAGEAAAERFYEWERRHEIEVAVADFPVGSDPGDLARSDPERLAAAVDDAKPFLGFRVERILASGRLDTPEGRARAAERALRVIEEHPSDLVRDQYVMAVADRCQVDPNQLRSGRTAPTTAGPHTRLTEDPPELRRQLEAIRVLVHRRDEVADRLNACLFRSDLARAAYEALANTDDFHAAVETAPPAAAELIKRLSTEDPVEDVDDVVALLVDETVARIRVRDLSPDLALWLRNRRDELLDIDRRRDSAAALVDWLSNGGHERT